MVLNRIPGPMLEPSLSSTNHRCLDSCLSHLEYPSNNGEVRDNITRNASKKESGARKASP